MDIGTGLTILGGALGGKDIIIKILGPTSDYIGDQVKEWTKKKVDNTTNIFKNAENKLGDKINSPGKVSPKVLKSVLEDGAWCEEELQVEYFGGVLASSRTGISRDDRGAYFTSLISRLSSYQLRLHYLFYHTVKRSFDGRPTNIGNYQDRQAMQVFIPMTDFIKAMDFVEEEKPNMSNILSHSMFGLHKEDLIGQSFNFGNTTYLKNYYAEANQSGIIFNPTHLGIQLMMWAYGHGQLETNDFFMEDLKLPNNQDIYLGEGFATKKK